MRMLAIVLLVAPALCEPASVEDQVCALRPKNTVSGEKAVLDDLQHRAQQALAGLKHPSSPAEADAARPELRRKLKRSLGVDLLPPIDLRARTVGILTRPGYRIEKIVFQSLPGVLVPAHLYIPDGVRGRAPAVLFYVGHWWPDSKARPDFQAFCINMARLGFVVLAWDPFGQGERGISSRDHRRVESLLVGVSQQGFAEYETRCALAYLLARREVDANRIGMTGASGGGYNTWITAALDDRIKVAVPVVGTSEFYEQISVTRDLNWYDAAEHCHFIPGLIRYANNHELLAMFAPKPLLIVAAAQDQSFPISGVKEVYRYGRDLYKALSAAGSIDFFEDTEEGHGYQKRKREAAYGWFLRWLANRGGGQPFAEPATTTEPFDSAELRCFPPGANEAAGPGMIAAVRRLVAQVPPHRTTLAATVLNGDGPAPHVTADTVQRLAIRSNRDLAIPAFLVRPKGHIRGIMIAVDDRGKEKIVADLPVSALNANGWAVLGVDPRGIGELRTSQMGWVAAVNLLLGENFVSTQAADLRRAMSSMRAALGNVPVGLYARGHNASLAATYALAADPQVSFYVLEGAFLTCRSWLDRPRSLAASYALKTTDRNRTTSFDREIPFAYVPFDALRSLDITEMLASSGARGLVVNAIDGDWEPMSTADVRRLLPAEVAAASGADTRDAVRRFLLEQVRSRQAKSRAS